MDCCVIQKTVEQRLCFELQFKLELCADNTNSVYPKTGVFIIFAIFVLVKYKNILAQV